MSDATFDTAPHSIGASSSDVSACVAVQPAPSYRLALVLLASLFFVWGFAAVLNNTLLPHLRAVFDLSYAQEMMIGATWFVAFFTVSLPAAGLIRCIGYRRSVLSGLTIMAAGALCMASAAAVAAYPFVLVALFVIAAGAAVLEVAANPYVTIIGPPETASSRLNLVQAFNSLGTTLAPLFGGWLILARSRSGSAVEGSLVESKADRLADAHSVVLPYLLMAAVLVLLAIFIAQFRLPDMAVDKRRQIWSPEALSSLLRRRNLLWGVLAIALYEVTEIGCANLFINFASQPTVGDLTHTQAAHFLFPLWGGMMVGRFAGSFLMRRVLPGRVLAAGSVLALLVLLVAVFGSGFAALAALVSVGLFHSVMFPTIFSLAIRGLGQQTELGSGLLIMAIGGGALTIGQGWLADYAGVQISFLVPAACELYILYFALSGSNGSPAAIAI